MMTKGNRKFTVVLVALMMAFTLALRHDLSHEFVTVASVAVGAFTTGNIAEHLKEIWSHRGES